MAATTSLTVAARFRNGTGLLSSAKTGSN